MAIGYRIRQFLRATETWVRPARVEHELLSRTLPPRAVALFLSMPGYDRGHSLAVLNALRAAGHDEPELLAAALLHDVGKTVSPLARIRLWHRVAAVLLRAVWPAALDRIGQDKAGSWCRPLFVQQHHAFLGAELARQAGCSPLTVELIRRHEDPGQEGDDPWLAALQAADNMN